MTFVCSPTVNVAVVLAAPPVDTDWPMPTASDEENASTIIMPGWWASRPCLEASLNITPDDEIMNRLEMSYLPGLSSSTRSIGLAKASPTMAIVKTRSRSMVASISSMSRLRASSVTVEPPPDSVMSWVNRPVPCMSGQPGSPMGPGRLDLVADDREVGLAVLDGRDEGADEGAEQVVLAPHHALGHARGATGVEQQQVVAAAAPRARDRVGASGLGGGLVRRGPRRGRARRRRRPRARW